MKYIKQIKSWKSLSDKIKKIFKKKHKEIHGGFDYAIGLETLKSRGGGMSLEITITDIGKMPITVNPFKTLPDGSRKAVKVDGAPTWEITDGTCTVAPDADGLRAYIISGDTDTDSTVKVSADADLGAGVVEISDTILVHVVSPQADNLGLSAGVEEPK